MKIAAMRGPLPQGPSRGTAGQFVFFVCPRLLIRRRGAPSGGAVLIANNGEREKSKKKHRCSMQFSQETICPLLWGTQEDDPHSPEKGEAAPGHKPPLPPSRQDFPTIFRRRQAPPDEPRQGGERPGSHRHSRGNLFSRLFSRAKFLIQIVRHNPGHSVSLQRSAEPQKALGVLNVLSRAEKSGTLKKNVHPLCGIPTSDRIIFWVSSGVPVVLTWYTVVRLRRSETYRFRIRALNGFFTSRCGLK